MSPMVRKWAVPGLIVGGGLLLLAMCSAATQSTAPSSPQLSPPEEAARQIAVIAEARQACSARLQVMGEVMAEGDAVRAIGLARNARSSCDEGFSAVFDLEPAKAVPDLVAKTWALALTNCSSSLRLWSDAAKAGEALAENANSPTAAHEAQQAALAAKRADESCAVVSQELLAFMQPTPAAN